MNSDTNGDRDKSPDDSTPAKRNTLVEYYRQKADDCLRFAAEATDEDTRDQWITLANGWTRLALQAGR
jgi:hypothetical protein